MAEAAAVALPDGVVPSDIALYKSLYRLALNLKVKVQKNRTYTFTKFVAASREGWGGAAQTDVALATAARRLASTRFSISIGPPGANYGALILSSTAIRWRRRSCTLTFTTCLPLQPPIRAGRWAPVG